MQVIHASRCSVGANDAFLNKLDSRKICA